MGRQIMRTLADQRLCEGYCGTLHSESEMSYGPDPYADEILGDNTPIWLCRECWNQSENDV